MVSPLTTNSVKTLITKSGRPVRQVKNEAAKRSRQPPEAARLEKWIKKELSLHLVGIGLNVEKSILNFREVNGDGLIHDKASIRTYHQAHRRERVESSAELIRKTLPKLMCYFASGTDIEVQRIRPRIELVKSGTFQSDLFRLASLTWSIPVSQGYGRRMRFVVWDEHNGKLMGLIALGDPVFNLRARDNVIGWGVAGRKEHLVNVMDCYVLGALPPYNMMLGGKLVACLVRTREVRDHFLRRYGKGCGIISKQRKHPRLVMTTTSSALGRSSVYNRLKLDGVPYFQSVGATTGYGHFHIPNEIFEKIRQYLKLRGHTYSDNNRFGNGPNWRFRTIRAALELMGIHRDLLHHGIKRELFICKLATNAEKVLRGENKRPCYKGLLSVEEVGALALERWILPRVLRRPECMKWKNEEIMNLLADSRLE